MSVPLQEGSGPGQEVVLAFGSQIWPGEWGKCQPREAGAGGWGGQEGAFRGGRQGEEVPVDGLA